MKRWSGAFMSVAFVCLLASCAAVGGAPAAADGLPADAQMSEFATPLDPGLTTLAVTLEGLDSASINAVADTGEDAQLSVVSQWTGTEPTASLTPVGEGAR